MIMILKVTNSRPLEKNRVIQYKNKFDYYALFEL